MLVFSAIRREIAKRRLERMVCASRAQIDVGRSIAAKQGHETRKANAVRGRYNRFIADPIVVAVLTNNIRRFDFGKAQARILLAARDGTECHWCKKILQIESGKLPDFATIDHVIPHSVGGSNSLNNLVLCCASCNSIRSDKERLAPHKVHKAKRALMAAVAA